MASVIDSFKETFGDKMSFLKLLVFTVPIFISYTMATNPKGDYGLATLLFIVTVFLFLGFLIKVTGNAINERDSLLPSLNPIKLAITATKAIIAIGPVAFISYILANYACSVINFAQWLDVILETLVWLIVASVVLTSFLMFAPKERIKDAYKMNLLVQKAGDLIVMLIVMVLQFLVINLPTTGFLAYTLFILFGFGDIFNFFLSFALIFNLAAMGQYLAQVHYEVFSYEK